MYRKIIVGHDLHEGGEDALAFGKLIAEKTGAKLVVAGVFPISHPFESQWLHEEKQKVAAEVQRISDEAGAEAEVRTRSSPARGLHELAEELDADLVVVGSSRQSRIGRIGAGDVGLALLHGSPSAVAIAPRGYSESVPGELSAITVGFDGSPESGVALEDAVELAKATGARIKLVAVAQPPPIVYGKGGGANEGWRELKEAIEQHLRERLDEALDSIPEGVSVDSTLISGDAAEELADAAAESSMLILGSRAYGPMRRVLLGSASSTLVRSAPCPVLVHPRGTKVEVATGRFANAGSAR